MFHLRALTHLLLFTAPAFAAWTPPDAGQLARLERALAPQHAQYDPAEQLIRRPFSTPGYHTTLKGGMVHPTKDSFAYALGLLDTGNPTTSRGPPRSCAAAFRCRTPIPTVVPTGSGRGTSRSRSTG